MAGAALVDVGGTLGFATSFVEIKVAGDDGSTCGTFVEAGGDFGFEILFVETKGGSDAGAFVVGCTCADFDSLLAGDESGSDAAAEFVVPV